jgi:hypothetical protein
MLAAIKKITQRIARNRVALDVRFGLIIMHAQVAPFLPKPTENCQAFYAVIPVSYAQVERVVLNPLPKRNAALPPDIPPSAIFPAIVFRRIRSTFDAAGCPF